ncbi:MAG: type II secretion system protein GspF, partial [Nitrospira sp.]|nr:type II secretion system protein GspF [Nitrospira sp.]
MVIHMPVYQYKGLRVDGQGTTGIIDADSLKGARQKLRTGGIYPIDVVEEQQGEVGRGLPVSAKAGSAVLSSQDLTILTRQLATLLAAGLPLVEALGVLIEQSERKS